MDAFRALTGGGVRFDKKRFAADIQPFQPKPTESSLGKRKEETLPDGLDFFGSSSTGNGATEDAATERKKNKKRKRESQKEAAAAELDIPAFLRQHRIKLTGLDPPDPVMSVPDSLKDGWRNSMGSEDVKPTAVQMASWGVMMAGRDLLACAPTGSGKTLAFLVPALSLTPPSASTSTPSTGPKVVILEPTRELAMQVLRETRKVMGPAAAWKVGVLGDLGGKKEKKTQKGRKKGKGKAEDPKEAVKADGEDSDDEVVVEEPKVETLDIAEKVVDPNSLDILFTTPLRLVFAVQSKLVDLSSVAHLILDEADKLFELNFVLQTDAILAACTNPKLRKAMFSATLPSTVEELARGVMSGGEIRAIVGHKDSANTSIDQTLTFVHTEDHKLSTLRSLIATGGFTPPVLIFVQSIPRAKELSHALLLDGISADCIHAERTAEERDEVVRLFASGKVWALVCTDVLGRGVDFKGVKLVVNYDFPQSAGSYIHRIGRTGRAGKAGRAITFFTKSDGPYLKSIVNVMRASGCAVEPWMLELKNPTQDQKKALKMKPLGRKDVGGLGKKEKLGRGKRVRVLGGGEETGKRSQSDGKDGEGKAKKKLKKQKVVMDE